VRKKHRDLGSNHRHAHASACLVLACCLATGLAGADEIGLEAYTITAEPRPGPIEEFQPIEELPSVPFDLPFDWGMDPFGDATWLSQLQSLKFLDPALAAGDFAYARDVFRDWQRWHTGGEAPWSWSDQRTGQRAARLAYLLDSTGWRDRSLVELAEQHAARLRDPEFVRDDHNHGIAQLHGLAALCLDGRLRSCRGSETFLEDKLNRLLRNQFTASGIHRENSPGYHFYALANFTLMAPILAKYASSYDETLRRAANKAKWLVHPDLTTVAVGDSDAALRASVQIPRGEPRCEDVRSYSDAPECYSMRHFKKVGYVIVRSDWSVPAEQASMLFIQGGFFNHAHRDSDDFSFEWFEHGRKILSDSGKYAYTRDNWQEYFNSTRAHSTVEVDGLNYTVKQEDAYGDAVEEAGGTGDGFRTTMQVYHPDLEVSHRRQIDYRPGEELRIRDTVRSDRTRVYIQWHHFTRAFELSGSDGRFELDDGELVVELEAVTSCGDRTKHWKLNGQLEPHLQGWASVADRERHARWALGVECEARTATFEARFEIKTR
jgi:Heparinase II/III-like protein/Heparinase II/III N-terminus